MQVATPLLAYIAEINSHTKSTEFTEGTRYARAYHPGCVGGDDLDSYVLLFLCQKKTRTSVLMSKRNCSSVKKETKMKVKLKIKQVNKNTQNSSMATALPVEAASSGGSFDWGKLLKILIAILTAIAGSIGLASCVN